MSMSNFAASNVGQETVVAGLQAAPKPGFHMETSLRSQAQARISRFALQKQISKANFETKGLLDLELQIPQTVQLRRWLTGKQRHDHPSS
jgi:hypothetical protein